MMYLQAFPYFLFVPFYYLPQNKEKKCKSRHTWKKSSVGEQSQTANRNPCSIIIACEEVSHRPCRCRCLLVKKCLPVNHANIVQTVKTCYKIKIDSRDLDCCFYGVLLCKQHPCLTIAPLLHYNSATIRVQKWRYCMIKVALL